MSCRTRPEGIGYLLRKFPVLSETFILNEMLAVEALGQPVHILSLAPSRDPRFHEHLCKLKASVSHVPDIFFPRVLLRYNVSAAKHYRRRYFAALVHALMRGRPLLFLRSAYVAERARRLGLRHLHAHFAEEPTSVALMASRISGIPYSFTAHAYDIYEKDVKPKVLAYKLEKARFVVTISDYNKAHLERLANGAAGKVVRIYNGIDLERFTPGSEPPRSPFTILSVARLQEKKGLHLLIEACRELHERKVVFQCWIVGRGRQRSKLQALIQKWQLGDRVRLLGHHTQLEVLERYRSAHLYVLPCIVGSDGNQDGLPVSIVEALACGLPVVTTPMTGIPEVVVDQHNGLLVPFGDARALADAIEAAIRDRHLYEHLRANARASIASRFDLRQTSRTLHGLFASAAS